MLHQSPDLHKIVSHLIDTVNLICVKKKSKKMNEIMQNLKMQNYGLRQELSNIWNADHFSKNFKSTSARTTHTRTSYQLQHSTGISILNENKNRDRKNSQHCAELW